MMNEPKRKTWSEMTEEEQAGLKMAHRMGLKIEYKGKYNNYWSLDIFFNPEEHPFLCYRIQNPGMK